MKTVLTLLLGLALGYFVAQFQASNSSTAYSISPLTSDEGQTALCDTDLDCFQKYGCGGYADPCEEDK